jgi:hypothetical protein
MRQKPISELRRRMLEDMAVRKFSEATIRNYIRHIVEFAKFLGRSPDTATAKPGARVYSMTSLARPRRVGGMVSPSAFAGLIRRASTSR